MVALAISSVIMPNHVSNSEASKLVPRLRLSLNFALSCFWSLMLILPSCITIGYHWYLGIASAAFAPDLARQHYEHIHDSPGGGIDSPCLACALDTYVIPFLKVGAVCICLHGSVCLSSLTMRTGAYRRPRIGSSFPPPGCPAAEPGARTPTRNAPGVIGAFAGVVPLCGSSAWNLDRVCSLYWRSVSR